MQLVQRAMILAAEAYGAEEKRTFNAAGFSNALRELSGVRQTLDGKMVEAILQGRSDVVSLGPGHSHYTYSGPLTPGPRDEVKFKVYESLRKERVLRLIQLKNRAIDLRRDPAALSVPESFDLSLETVEVLDKKIEELEAELSAPPETLGVSVSVPGPKEEAERVPENKKLYQSPPVPPTTLEADLAEFCYRVRARFGESSSKASKVRSNAWAAFDALSSIDLQTVPPEAAESIRSALSILSQDPD